LELQSDYEDHDDVHIDIHDDNCNYQQIMQYKRMYEIEKLKNHHLQQQIQIYLSQINALQQEQQHIINQQQMQQKQQNNNS